MTWTPPSALERQAILRDAKTIAIVGASDNPARASYFVGTYLLSSSDYTVWFVNPMSETVLGHKAYKSLADLPAAPDIVDVFRKPSDLPESKYAGKVVIVPLKKGYSTTGLIKRLQGKR